MGFLVWDFFGVLKMVWDFGNFCGVTPKNFRACGADSTDCSVNSLPHSRGEWSARAAGNFEGLRPRFNKFHLRKRIFLLEYIIQPVVLET